MKKQKVEITVLDNGYIVEMRNWFYGDVPDRDEIVGTKEELMELLEVMIFEVTRPRR